MAKWDLKKALNVCRAFEEIGIEWIEEPLYGYDFEGLAELRKRTTLHVAGGELNAQVHEYRDSSSTTASTSIRWTWCSPAASCRTGR